MAECTHSVPPTATMRSNVDERHPLRNITTSLHMSCQDRGRTGSCRMVGCKPKGFRHEMCPVTNRCAESYHVLARRSTACCPAACRVRRHLNTVSPAALGSELNTHDCIETLLCEYPSDLGLRFRELPIHPCAASARMITLAERLSCLVHSAEPNTSARIVNA